MIQGLKFAYKQAPWRKQLRGIAAILLCLVIFILVAIANLNVSARTYEAGLTTTSLTAEAEKLNQSIADMRVKLSTITTYQVMTKKAAEMGYQTAGNDNKLFFVIPGYQEPELVISAPVTLEKPANPSVVKPAYTQSLWDLFLDGALKFSKNTKR